jgi:hypothetical protein
MQTNTKNPRRGPCNPIWRLANARFCSHFDRYEVEFFTWVFLPLSVKVEQFWARRVGLNQLNCVGPAAMWIRLNYDLGNALSFEPAGP